MFRLLADKLEWFCFKVFKLNICLNHLNPSLFPTLRSPKTGGFIVILWSFTSSGDFPQFRR